MTAYPSKLPGSKAGYAKVERNYYSECIVNKSVMRGKRNTEGNAAYGKMTQIKAAAWASAAINRRIKITAHAPVFTWQTGEP